MKLILWVVCVISCLYTTVGFQPRINHGATADRNNYKYVVAIDVQPTLGNQLNPFTPAAYEEDCTGGIIHEKLILTAAHCFAKKHVTEEKHGKQTIRKVHYTFNKDKVKIYAHTNNAKKLSKDAITVKAKRVHFVANFFNNGNDDIAILELEEGLHLEGKNKDKLQKLEFPKPLSPKSRRNGNDKHVIDGYKTYGGAECVIAGFGEDRHNNDASLKHMKSQILDVDNCRYDVHTVMCGKAIDENGHPPKHALGICVGDSGAPVVLETHDSTKTVIGVITAFDGDCDSRKEAKPEGYMRVSHYLEFINHVIHGKKDNKEYITKDLPEWRFYN